MDVRRGVTVPLSLGRAAQRIGIGDAQRLRKYLLAKERSTGRDIMVRLGGPYRVRYSVTLAVLRDRCPELFCRRDETAAALREHLDDALDDLRSEVRHLRQRDELLAQEIRRQSRRVA